MYTLLPIFVWIRHGKKAESSWHALALAAREGAETAKREDELVVPLIETESQE